MRIISGDHKGRRLFSIRGMATRPTSDRVREALFNILGTKPDGAQVLDLYAGTGALGIEALSRGANHAVFVDRSGQALTILRKNIAQCNLGESSRILQWDITKNLNCLKPYPQTFDLVFMDPPYHKHFVPLSLSHLSTSQCLKTTAMVVAEHETGETLEATSSGFQLERTRHYGQTTLSFFLQQPP